MEGGVAKEFGTEKNDDNGNSEDLRETSVSFVSEIQAEMRMQQNEPMEKRHKGNWILRGK